MLSILPLLIIFHFAKIKYYFSERHLLRSVRQQVQPGLLERPYPIQTRDLIFDGLKRLRLCSWPGVRELLGGQQRPCPKFYSKAKEFIELGYCSFWGEQGLGGKHGWQMQFREGHRIHGMAQRMSAFVVVVIGMGWIDNSLIVTYQQCQESPWGCNLETLPAKSSIPES